MKKTRSRINQNDCAACGNRARRRVLVPNRVGHGKNTQYACMNCYCRAQRNGDFWDTPLKRRARFARESVKASVMLAEGKTYLQIARALNMSVSSVKNRLK